MDKKNLASALRKANSFLKKSELDAQNTSSYVHRGSDANDRGQCVFLHKKMPSKMIFFCYTQPLNPKKILKYEIFTFRKYLFNQLLINHKSKVVRSRRDITDEFFINTQEYTSEAIFLLGYSYHHIQPSLLFRRIF